MTFENYIKFKCQAICFIVTHLYSSHFLQIVFGLTGTFSNKHHKGTQYKINIKKTFNIYQQCTQIKKLGKIPYSNNSKN